MLRRPICFSIGLNPAGRFRVGLRKVALSIMIHIDDTLFAILIREMRDHNEFPIFLLRYYPAKSNHPIGVALEPLFVDVRTQLDAAANDQIEDEINELNWFLKQQAVGRGALSRDGVGLDWLAIAIIAKRMHRVFFAPEEGLKSGPSSESRVFRQFPELHEQHDKRGLLCLTDEFCMRDGGLVYRDHLLHYHQFLRRGFTSNPNFDFLSEFSEYRSKHPENSFRIAIDHRRITPIAAYRSTIELDYWWGPPMAAKALDDPDAIGLTVHGRRPEYNDTTTDKIERTEFYWTYGEGVKSIEIEEVRPCSTDWRLVINRYAHAERDIRAMHFRHFDGAAKAYDSAGYDARLESNMPREPKASPYVKLFRIDGRLSADDWSMLACLFFRGNEMVVDYLNPGYIERESARRWEE